MDPDGTLKKQAAGDTLNPQQVRTSETGLASTISPKMDRKAVDVFEAIDIQGQKKAGIWVHHPGSEIAQPWEPRKGKKSKHVHSETVREDSPRTSNASSQTSCSETTEYKKPNLLQRGLQKFNDARHKQRNRREEDGFSRFAEEMPSPHLINVKPVDTNRIGVNLVVKDSLSRPLYPSNMAKGEGEGGLPSNDGDGPESAKAKTQAKEVAKNIIKQAGKNLKHALSKKGSKRFIRNLGGVKERGFSDLESDSSQDESPCYESSLEGSPIVSRQWMDIDDGSFRSWNHVVHSTTSDSAETRRT